MRAGQANGAKKGLKIGTREGRINGYKKGIKQGVLGAGVIAGGIAAYNHFKNSNESLSLNEYIERIY